MTLITGTQARLSGLVGIQYPWSGERKVKGAWDHGAGSIKAEGP